MDEINKSLCVFFIFYLSTNLSFLVEFLIWLLFVNRQKLQKFEIVCQKIEIHRF